MRAVLIGICFAMLFTVPAIAQDQEAKPQVVNAYDLNNGKAIITGRFGQPLGECLQLRGKVYRDMRFKATSGNRHLMVTHVNGEKLQQPVTGGTCAEAPFAKNKISSDQVGLIKLDDGLPNNKQLLAVLEKQKVGDVNLVAYETGGFYGKANNLPKDIPEGLIVQRSSDEFRFKLNLIVVKVEDDPARQKQAPVQK